jgi:hypothetical protein
MAFEDHSELVNHFRTLEEHDIYTFGSKTLMGVCAAVYATVDISEMSDVYQTFIRLQMNVPDRFVTHDEKRIEVILILFELVTKDDILSMYNTVLDTANSTALNEWSVVRRSRFVQDCYMWTMKLHDLMLMPHRVICQMDKDIFSIIKNDA